MPRDPLLACDLGNYIREEMVKLVDVQAMLKELRGRETPEPFEVGHGLLHTRLDKECPRTEATLKISVGDREVHVAGDGVGPIDALNNALRKGVVELFEGIQEVRLYDYHVDLIKAEGNISPSGVVKSTAKFHFRGDHWQSIAEHANQDYAGWKAILDAYVLAAMLHR
jgi:2-isopropylmalate synthase